MRIRALAFAVVVLSFAFSLAAQEPQGQQTEAQKVLDSIDWVEGPGKGEMEKVASIAVPQGYTFAHGADTRKLMELMENPVSGRELGFLSPQDQSWFMVFEFDPVGYVKDDERDSLDADAILKNIREGTEAGNEERRKRGWATMEILGWEETPRYDTASNNLTWAIRGRSGTDEVINYNTRILGRGGVMEVALVCDPEQLATVKPVARKLLADYAFQPGQKYAEFRKGDKLAEYGLAALITGGSVAVAAKTGLLAKVLKALAKFGIFIVAGIAAAAKKLFGKKQEQQQVP